MANTQPSTVSNTPTTPTQHSTSSKGSTSTSSKSNGVSPGAVAGIAIGVGIGVALIAVITTFLIMRRQYSVRRSRDSRYAKQHELGERNGGKASRKVPSATVDDYLPQPADDDTVKTKTKTLFVQLDLFVENFCSVKPNNSEVKTEAPAELSAFDSPYLPKPLSSSLQRARDAHPLIKHALARYITSRITPAATTEETLLPADLALLSNATTANASKTGFTKCLARWRALTAYIRPDPASDPAYLATRDRTIAQAAHSFIAVFAPWMNAKYNAQECLEALTALLQEAAGLGIFLLSQAPELAFQWPGEGELEKGRLVVKPALVKCTDELGERVAREAQVLVGAPVVRV